MLTKKLSQDHLELFFGAVRFARGFINNPTAQQFTAAYKRLLLRSSIAGGKGNCQKRDLTSILYLLSDTCIINDDVTTGEAALIRKYDLAVKIPMQRDHDYGDAPNTVSFSEYKVAAISYIAGYVGKMEHKQITCSLCCHALGARDHHVESRFLRFKDRGLFKPTQSAIKVCEEKEWSSQRMIASNGRKLP